MGTLLIILICFGLPGIGFMYLQRKHSVIIPFIVGALVFFISQIVLRIPLLNLLSQQISFQIFMLNVIPYVIFLAFTAGLFEEVGRWIGFQCIHKHWTKYDALAFGLGHGAIEAILLTALPILQMGNVNIDVVLMGGIERISAMIIHVGFTLIVWKGVKTKKIRYLLYAIIGHALFDFVAVMLSQYRLSIELIEGILFILSISLFGISYKTLCKKEEC